MREGFDNEIERWLADRLDGDLTADEARRLDEALAADAALRDELQGLERIDEQIRALAAKPCTADLRGFRFAVMGQVRREAATRTRTVRVYRIVAAAVPLAAAAALAFALTLVWGPSNRTRNGSELAETHATVEVAYVRPSAITAAAAVPNISFPRSDELARKAVEADADKDGPAWALAVAPEQPSPTFFDTSALIPPI